MLNTGSGMVGSGVVGTGVVGTGVVGSGSGGMMRLSSSPLYFEQHWRKASTQLQSSVM